MLWRKIIVFWQAASSNLVQVVRKGFLEEVTLELGANRRASVSRVRRQESRGRVPLAGGVVILFCFVQTSLVLALQIPQQGKFLSPGKLKQLVSLGQVNCVCKGPEADGRSPILEDKRASMAGHDDQCESRQESCLQDAFLHIKEFICSISWLLEKYGVLRVEII